MPYIHLVIGISIFQYILFMLMVGKARSKYDVKAPATTGNEHFERIYRVQMNTLELLVIFIPSLWFSAQYWSPLIMSIIGLVYILGRFIYLSSYISDPKKRGIGFMLSFFPIVFLTVAMMAGAAISFTH